MIATLTTPIRVILHGYPAKMIALAEEDRETYALVISMDNKFEYVKLWEVTPDPDFS